MFSQACHKTYLILKWSERIKACHQSSIQLNRLKCSVNICAHSSWKVTFSQFLSPLLNRNNRTSIFNRRQRKSKVSSLWAGWLDSEAGCRLGVSFWWGPLLKLWWSKGTRMWTWSRQSRVWLRLLGIQRKSVHKNGIYARRPLLRNEVLTNCGNHNILFWHEVPL